MMMASQRVWWFALFVAGVLLLYALRPILTPFVIAWFVAYLGAPAVGALAGQGWPRAAGAAVVLAVFLLLFIVGVLGLLPLIAAGLDAIFASAPAWLDELDRLVESLIEASGADESGSTLQETLKTQVATHWQEAGRWLADALRSAIGTLTGAFGFIASLLLVPIVAFYLLKDWNHLARRALAALDGETRVLASGLLREADRVLAGFLRGQLMVMTLLAVYYTTGLAVIGLEHALVIGAVVGMLAIVPYLGFAIGLTLAVAAAWFGHDSLSPVIGVGVVFLIGQLIESLWLTPRIVGDKVGLHPVVVIFAVLAGGQLAGFAGVLLALPVTAVIVAWLRYLHAHATHGTSV